MQGIVTYLELKDVLMIAEPGNIGNIPLVIIGAICREKGNPFEHPDTCNTNGVAYISFGQWVRFLLCHDSSLENSNSCFSCSSFVTCMV